MKNILFIGLVAIIVQILFINGTVTAQVPEVKHAVKFDVSIPLRDMKPVKKPFWKRWERENEENEVPNRFKNIPPNYSAPPDPALQANSPANTDAPLVTNPIINFDGLKNSNNSGRVTPPDPNGDVGPTRYVQVVNSMLQMFDKSGTSVYGPVTTSTIWNGFSGNWTGHNDGDAVILYDENADRWLISQFAIDCGTYPNYTEYQLVAISVTGDPAGSYYRFAFQFDYMPDYPKLAVWNDGYYMAINRFNTNNASEPFIGAAGCAMNRTKMLAGDASAEMVFFNTETLGGSGSALGSDCYSMLPSDCDGTWAPSGTPNYFTYINDNTVSPYTSELRIWALHADWTTTTNSTFTFVTNLAVTAYTMLGTGAGVVPQQGTTNKLDGLGDRLMFRNQYRNFGSYASFVTCHNVNIGSGIAGVRWYEYRKTGTTWSVYQQSSFNPGDGKSRWLGSIAMNLNGDIGLAYTVSSSTMYPSIYFTGRKAADALNTMTVTEGIIQTGTASITGATRWGDYAAMNVDPSDNATFWTTNEYIGTYGGTWPWATKIASFKFTNQPSVATQDASAISSASATLNGTVNPNGLATNYHFEWGTTVSYGNNTSTLSAGSGTSTVSESAAITGLTAGTTYHFRISAVNSDGTTNGNDFTFIPGAATVTTTAVTGITGTTATSGGTVTFDGGSSVTARGVCWSTSASPVATGSHTSDGSGTGTFTSSITGLTANTTYYLRAYATNANGTYYGTQVQFTTACGIFSLPFNENFATSSLPNCWTKQSAGGATDLWTVSNTANAGGTAYEMKSTYQNLSPATTRLVTPPLNTVGVSQLNLSFRHMLDAYGTGCTLRVQSSNDGITWTNEAWSVASTATNIAAALVSTTVLSNLNSTTTYIAFTIEGNLYQYDYWYIDAVSISNACATTYPVSVSIAASANNICAGTSVTFTPTPVNGGTPTYQWYKNSVAATTGSTYTYTPSNGDQIYVVMTSSLTCTTGNPATSLPITMIVNPVLPVSVSLAADFTSVCIGSTVHFTATPTNGGSSPVYAWYKNSTLVPGVTGATYSYVPTNGDQVYVMLTSSETCKSGSPATSSTINIAVTPILPVSVSLAADFTTVCAGTTVHFTATPTNGGSSPVYVWYKNSTLVSGVTGATYSYIPTNGDQVYVMLTSSESCKSGSPATSSTIAITVNPVLPVSVSLAADFTTVCAGTTVHFTATPTNGGSSPVYAWYKNTTLVPGVTGATYSYVPTNGDQVYVILTSSETCKSGSPATSSTINIAVNPILPVSVSLAADFTTVCKGKMVHFTATPTNGGSSPVYAWYKNSTLVSGITGATYTYIPTNGDQVYVMLTSSETCKSGSPATSSTITMTVNPVLLVSVYLAADYSMVCAGTTVNFTATPTNGGSSPVYAWYKNSTLVSGITGATYSYVPANGDQVYVMLTSSETCKSGSPATSSTINIIVNPILPVSVSLAADFTTVCSGTAVNLTATPTNGGSSPVYAWYKNTIVVPGVTGTTYSYIPTNGDQVYVMLTSSETCKSGSPATSGTVTLIVNPVLPVSVSVEPSENPVLDGTSVTFTATATNGGSAPLFQWIVNGINAGTNSPSYSYIPVNNDEVSCTLISNAVCASGNPATSGVITMVVNPLILTVNPSNMTVTSSEGITAFNVTSNTNWTVLSDQSWCTVDPSGSGNGTIHASYSENTTPDLRVANITVAIAGLTPVVVTVTQQGIPYKVLNLKLYLEGLYNISSGEMNPAQGSSGNQFGDGIADRVTVELHQAIYPYNIAYNFSEVNLNTDGTLTINTIPVNITGSYYIVIRHRNSIETWSSFPVSFDIPSPVSFDFSTAATQAFSSNMKLIGSVYAILTGDVTQDGIVDGSDMSDLFNVNQPSVLIGYYPEDVNGDGIVNGFDMSLVFNNSQPPPIQVKKP